MTICDSSDRFDVVLSVRQGIFCNWKNVTSVSDASPLSESLDNAMAASLSVEVVAGSVENAAGSVENAAGSVENAAGSVEVATGSVENGFFSTHGSSRSSEFGMISELNGISSVHLNADTAFSILAALNSCNGKFICSSLQLALWVFLI